MSLMEKLRTAPTDITLAPDHVAYRLIDRRVHQFAGLPMITVAERPLGGWSYFVKALEDRVLAAVAMVLFAPVMLAISILIRMDSPGPALFRQPRYGFNNNIFNVYKFRTMYQGPPPDRLSAAAPEAVPEGIGGVAQAQRNDPRVTRIGRFLRRTSLDELPQIFNVLRGEMSMVGPRPHAIAHNEEFAKIIDQYMGRHRVKPGITGWAQIHGLRGETGHAGENGAARAGGPVLHRELVDMAGHAHSFPHPLCRLCERKRVLSRVGPCREQHCPAEPIGRPPPGQCGPGQRQRGTAHAPTRDPSGSVLPRLFLPHSPGFLVQLYRGTAVRDQARVRRALSWRAYGGPPHVAADSLAADVHGPAGRGREAVPQQAGL